MKTLLFIKKNGISRYYEIQRVRMDLLSRMLEIFDDGRSKSFYCICASLISTNGLEGVIKQAENALRTRNIETRKERAGILKILLKEAGGREGAELVLKK